MLTAAVSSPYAEILHKILNGDQSGIDELHRVFSRGVRLYLSRHFPPQLVEDRLRHVFFTVEQAIRCGDLREPERLPAFVRTAIERRGKGPAQELARLGGQEGPAAQKRAEMMTQVLGSLPPRDREALVRFYLGEQTERRICADLRISAMQFRLLKSRAKGHFALLGRERERAVAI